MKNKESEVSSERGRRHGTRIITLGLLFVALAGCGGGGGGGSAPVASAPIDNTGSGGSGAGGVTTGGTGGTAPTYTAGVFPVSSTFAHRCASPRAGTSDVAGSTLLENFWLRSWTNELYLWYREVPDQNPANFATTADYFQVLKTTATTASGALKDKLQFHFTYATDDWQALSQSGATFGYGATWSLNSKPPRNVIVAYTEPGYPAVSSGINLARGARVLTVDGVDTDDATSAGVAKLNAGLFPTAAGQTHTFVVRDAGSASSRTVVITSAAITETPVKNVQALNIGGINVGYMLFNDHIATAESALVSAINTLKAANVQDLVLDIRYNGGGYLDIASELAYMIAGPTQTNGKTFELLQFNDKYPINDPVTGQKITPTLFHSTTQGFSLTSGAALPTLGLNRVFVLTGPTTCSASESIINGLRGVDVNVIQIGSTTCGKPYGFYPQDNCGTTYFSIEFRGVNAKGFGDYTDGFSPTNTASPSALSEQTPGCSVADDFNHALGDPAEARFAAALGYRNSQTCPAATGLGKAQVQSVQSGGVEMVGVVPKSPWLENRILRKPTSD